MIKRISFVIWLSLAVLSLTAAEPVGRTIRTGGVDREYLMYTPQNPKSGKPAGIIVCLHGLNSSMRVFFDEYHFLDMADSLNYILLSPQALPEQEQGVRDAAAVFKLLTGAEMPLNAVWGCGLNVKAKSTLLDVTWLDEELNQFVDDAGFIDLMITRTLNEQGLEAGRNVFVAGVSLGGYMAYQLALLHGEKLSGLISIAGSMGVNIKNREQGVKIPVCDFHSLTDEVVPYTGSFERLGTQISLAQDKSEVIDYWVRKNGASTDPAVEAVRYHPSSNGITVEKFTYSDPENEVIHYRMNGAEHGHFFRREAGDCMDYAEEISKFIASHAKPSDDSGNTGRGWQNNLFYPNPARDLIHFDVPDGSAAVYDRTGQPVLSRSFHSGQLDVSSLKPGVYVIRIQTSVSIRTAKLMKR